MEPRNGGGSVSVGIGDGGGIVNPAFQPPSLLSQQSTVWTRRQQAVCVRHAFKHYGSSSKPNHVLSNLNMTVAKGTMSVYIYNYITVIHVSALELGKIKEQSPPLSMVERRKKKEIYASLNRCFYTVANVLYFIESTYRPFRSSKRKRL